MFSSNTACILFGTYFRQSELCLMHSLTNVDEIKEYLESVIGNMTVSKLLSEYTFASSISSNAFEFRRPRRTYRIPRDLQYSETKPSQVSTSTPSHPPNTASTISTRCLKLNILPALFGLEDTRIVMLKNGIAFLHM